MVNLKGRAIFTCKTNGSDITYWKVNGTIGIPPEISDDVYTDRITVGNTDLFILIILARAVYNGTTIQCFTTDIGGNAVYVESENVTLTIQGVIYMYVQCMY